MIKRFYVTLKGLCECTVVIFATDPLVCLKVQIRLNRGLLTRKQKVNRVFIKLPILLNRTCPIIYTFRRIISNRWFSLSKIMVKRGQTRSNEVTSSWYWTWMMKSDIFDRNQIFSVFNQFTRFRDRLAPILPDDLDFFVITISVSWFK